MKWEVVAFEAVKLLFQFGGALFIAWCAVRWALGRYKREKFWEKKLNAYADLLSAIATMDQILGIWETEELTERWPTSETKDDVRKRYWEARRRIEEAKGVASMLLPHEVVVLLGKLPNEIDNAKFRATSWMEEIGEEWAILSSTQRKIVELGRQDLELIAPSIIPQFLRRKSSKSSSKA